MNRSCPPIITALLSFLLLSPSPLLAQESSGAPVSASVPTTGTSVPQLLTPKDNSYTKNPHEQFSWQEATASGGIDHYTFYLDSTITAGYLPTNTNSQETSHYSYSRSNNKGFLTLKDPLSEGAHTWKVFAYYSSGALKSTTYSFTVDTTLPIIILEKLAQNSMYWASNDSHTFPPFSDRQLTVHTDKPLLVGKVEANTNLKIAFLCPLSATNCSDISYTLSDPDGNWIHRVRNLKEDIQYTVYLIATDYASNTTYFPVFTVTYKPRRLFPPLPGILKPTPTPTPSPSPIPKAPKPPQKPPAIPPAPLPPLAPSPAPTPTPTAPLITPLYLLLIIVFGLLIHLLSTAYSAGIKLWHLPKLLFRLLLPYARLARYQTSPLSTILLYDASDQQHIKHLKTKIATVTGHFHLSPTLPPTVYLRILHPRYQNAKHLLSSTDLPEVFPLEKIKDSSLKLLTHQIAAYLRPLSLLIALGTSIYAYLMVPKASLLAYGGLSLYLLVVEYLPPVFSSEAN